VKYEEVLEWMYSQLPMYQRKGKFAYKKDLINIKKLAKHLGNPEKKFRSIHIAGTNGKGSVSHMLASVLQEAGYKTGLYTSPHLVDFRERIRINGQMIRKNCVINFIKRNKDFFIKNRLSFFEMTVGLAFEQFAKKKVDIAVVEVGLGGRLDSTNIINPEVSVITNISKDHTAMLGNDLKQIAFEKAGIIKPNVPVVIGELQKETIDVFKKIAGEKSAPLYIAQNNKALKYTSDLKGNYQEKNIKTVLKTLDILQSKDFVISEAAIKKGLLKVRENTGLRGRWDIIQENPLIILDTAHNEAGIKEVVKQLLGLNYNRLHIVLSMVNDKDFVSILKLFPKDALYYITKADIPRALDEKILYNTAIKEGLKAKSYQNIQLAFDAALSSANKEDIVFVGGSTFTVAGIL